MNPLPEELPQPLPVIPVLSYGRPDTKVPFLLHTGLALVALMDILGGFGLIMAGVTGLAAPASLLNIWMLLFGMLLFTPGVMVWSRTVYAWRRSLVLLYANGILLTLVSFAAALRLLHSIGTVPADSIFFNLFFGGAWGTLNWCGAYILCRAKRAFHAGHVDTVRCERLGLAFPIPLALLAAAVVILAKYYP